MYEVDVFTKRGAINEASAHRANLARVLSELRLLLFTMTVHYRGAEVKQGEPVCSHNYLIVLQLVLES
jgi:hypothetical protein